jgi:hypothetical protein
MKARDLRPGMKIYVDGKLVIIDFIQKVNMSITIKHSGGGSIVCRHDALFRVKQEEDPVGQVEKFLEEER